jgi:hypothetical protein
MPTDPEVELKLLRLRQCFSQLSKRGKKQLEAFLKGDDKALAPMSKDDLEEVHRMLTYDQQRLRWLQDDIWEHWVKKVIPKRKAKIKERMAKQARPDPWLQHILENYEQQETRLPRQ